MRIQGSLQGEWMEAAERKYPCFTGGKLRHRDKVICPQSHRQSVSELESGSVLLVASPVP